VELERETADVVVVGAGPCGLAAAIAAKRAGLRATVIERGCVVSGIASYPTYMTFFSTAGKLSIGGVPFVVASEKPTRRDALAYYRAVVEHHELDVRQYERVVGIERLGEAKGRTELTPAEPGGPPPNSNMSKSAADAAIASTLPAPAFRTRSVTQSGRERVTDSRAVVIATGYFGSPNRLGVPGEDLPHVTHHYREGHEAFRRRAVVIGGGNSGVEAALDLHAAGARVTLVHFGPTFDRNIKPWVLPTIEARMSSGEIGVRWNSQVTSIDPESVTISTDRGTERLPADHVYLMIGYMPEVGLLKDLGVPIDAETGIPQHDPVTMETAEPGVFIAGVIASGYDANKTFIENGRFHGDLIVQRMLAAERGSAAENPSPS
jgi:thioredoxin reductase (NADPH)